MQPVFIIKPNVKKVCLINVIKVAAAVIIIIVAVTYSKSIIDLSLFKDALEISDKELPAPGIVLMNFILASVLAAMIAFVVSYLSASKREYMFYPDRIEIYNNFLIFNLTKVIIPLANVVSVTAEMSGEKKLFGLGRIVFQLTAMKDKTAIIDDIDQPDYYVPYIQKLLNEVRAKFDTEYKFNATVDRTLSGL